MTSELQALLDACVDAVVIVNHHGTIETFNPAAEQLFGYRADEIIGRNVSALMPERDQPHHDNYLQRYIQTREPRVIGIGRTVEARRCDGSLFPASLAIGQIAGSEPPRFVGFLHDLSERREHENQILRQGALLREAQRIAQIGNFEVHVPARPGDHGSDEFHRILGLPPDEPVTLQALAARLRPADRSRVEVALRLLHTGTEPAEMDSEYQFERQRGEVRYAHINLRVTTTPDGAVRHVGTLHDVTDRRRAQDTIRETQERLTHVARLSTMGEMTNGLAHELNQPLTAIALYAQAAERLMKQTHPGEEDVLNALHQITTQALRAGAIIHRLRAMVKNRETHEEVIDLGDLLHELVILAEVDARVHGATLVLDLGAERHKVMADPVQLQQVLLNLVRNAIEAVENLDVARRTVSLRTMATATGEAEISVSDTGSGVDAGVRDRLFNAFFTTKPEGTGLGLAISRSIIENHGGRLAYRPNEPAGSCFYFTLPALKGDQT